MRKFIQKIINFKKETQDIDIRERLFRMLLMVGSVICVLGIMEGFIIGYESSMYSILSFLSAGLMVCLVLTFGYRKDRIAAFVMAIVLSGCVFPAIMLAGGGTSSGSTMWAIIGIFFIFTAFSGPLMYFLLALAVIVNGATYLLMYYYPDKVLYLEGRSLNFYDSFFSQTMIGIALGTACHFALKLYDEERAIKNEQSVQLQKMSKAKNQFFANMSHELRSPINTIIGLNEVILREEGLSAETRENAENVKRASESLLMLVNDILDISQMEAAQMEIMPDFYDTKEFIKGIIDSMAVQMKDKGLEFLLDIDDSLPTRLYGDSKRIKQVVINLLTNAVKYTKEGSVTLGVKSERVAEDEILLSVTVTDTGIGIKKENLEHLYDTFHRINDENVARIEGTGLGLPICKNLMDLMGGKISVDSIYTKGSIFTISLRQYVADETFIGHVDFSSPMDNISNTKYTHAFEAPEASILVVDDAEMNLLVVEKLLAKTKVKIEFARSGRECLEKTKQKYYNLILMDYMMPGLNGASTMQALRRQDNGLCKDSPVVVLSANVESESSRIAKEFGFDGFLTKPIDSKLLEELVLSFLPEDIIEYRRDVIQEKQIENTIEMIRTNRRKKVRITADCFCDLSDSQLDTYDIHLIYTYIETDEGRFKDRQEINVNNLATYFKKHGVMTTAVAATVEDYEKFFADNLSEADDVIHLSLASHLGQSYGHAVKAAEGFDHVHVIDSKQVSAGMGLVVLTAAKLAQDYFELDEIIQKLQFYINKTESQFLLPAARLFRHKGYVNKYLQLLCDGFGLHPVVGMKNSRFKVLGFYRGTLMFARRRFVRFYLGKHRRINNDVLFVTHAGCSVKEMTDIREAVENSRDFERIILQEGAVSNACIAGLGTVGIAYMSK